MNDAAAVAALNALLREGRALLDAGRREDAAIPFRRVAATLAARPDPLVQPVRLRPGDTGTAYAVTVFSPPKLPMQAILQEVAEAVVFGLGALGLDAVLTTDLVPTPRRRILLGAGCLPNARKLGHDGTLALREDTILYQLEQVTGPEHFLTSSVLPWFLAFPAWDYSLRNLESLRLIGLETARHVPLGYVPQWTRIPERTQDVDVLFYGILSERRKRVLDELHRRGAKVVCLVNCFGAERDAWIARSRIVLNVHHYEARIFEYPRVLYLLANRKCVVSESGNDPAERDYAEGVAFAEYGDLAGTCLRLLESPTDRERIAEAGFRLISARPMADGLRAALA